MTNITTIASAAKTAADKLGIQKFDIYGSAVDETSVQVDQGQPHQMKASQRSGVTVRVWNPAGSVGVTSTTDLDATGLELALKTAYEASEFGVTDNIPDFSPEATLPLPSREAPSPSAAAVATLLSTLADAEKQLLEAHPAIVGVPYNGLAQKAIDRFYVNSDGAVRQEAHTISSVYLYTKTEEEGKKTRSAGAFRIATGLPALDLSGCVQEAAEKTISHLNYEKIPTGKYKVVLSPEAFLSLLGAFSNLFNAQSILDHQSLSTPESLGQAIAAPLLSVYDDPLNEQNIGAETFDGEGTPTRRVALITEGVLTNFLHSAGTAKRLGATPTGNANMGAKITVGPHFFQVAPGAAADPVYDLATADQVILIDELQALHAGVQALQGSFSLPFDGWLLQNGKRISVESATVAGDFRQVLKSIVHLSSDAHFTGSGISPYVWIDELSVTGD
jgi:PmbA protein